MNLPQELLSTYSAEGFQKKAPSELACMTCSHVNPGDPSEISCSEVVPIRGKIQMAWEVHGDAKAAGLKKSHELMCFSFVVFI